MKISEVEVGTEYGAADSPRGSSFRGGDPRQVKVVEIVSVEERVHGRYSSGVSVRKIKRVQVLVLNGEKNKQSSWARDKIANSSKGDTLVIEARQLVGKWADLFPAIRERAAKEQQRIDLEEITERRVKKLGFRLGYQEVNVRVDSTGTLQLTFSDKQAERALKLMEEASRG